MSGISVQDVTKRFGGVTVLHGVTLAVMPGEFVALVGPSGCGKTTLMRIVAGIEHADAGRIGIAGRDVTGLRAAERDVAMVFQSYALYPHLTVAQNIAVPLVMRKLSAWQRMPLVGGWWPGSRAARGRIREDAAQAAAALGLGTMLDRRPAQLSGGQRQRVALARAIVRSPKAFLMDEPLSNLDAALRVQTRREIVDIHRRVGAATLYVTHDQSEALTMADRVAVMLGGRILQIDSPERIYTEPQHVDVATFIGSPRINTVPTEGRSDGAVTLAGVPLGIGTPTRGPLTLAIRPEDLRPDPAGPIEIAREHVEFLGESLLVHGRLLRGDAAVTLRLAPGSHVPDQRFRLSFAPERALLFDAAGHRAVLRQMAEANA